MNKTIVKSALLAAVAASCGYAGAATIAPIASALDTGLNVSLEGATIGNTTLGADKAVNFAVSVTTAVSHFAGDEWQLTLSGTGGGKWATAGAASVSVACADGNITLDQLPTYSADGKSLTFTVAGTSGTTSSVQCNFSSLSVQGPTLTAGAVKVSFAAKRPSSSTFDRDLTTTAATAFSVASQIGDIIVSSAFNGTVDYQGSAGKGFSVDDGTILAGSEDQLEITIEEGDDDTAYSLASSTASLSIVLKAESGKKFSFLDVNQDGSCTLSELTATSNGNVGASGSGLAAFTINTACTEITFTSAAASVPGAIAGDTVVTVALGSRFASPSVGTSGVAITPMDFGDATTINLNEGSVVLASDTVDAGEWDSNGSTVNIPYMPVNTVAASRIAPVVYITNRSLVSGPATAVLRNESGVECSVDLGTIESTRTTNVSNLINDAVKRCYNTSSAAEAAGHRLSITITASLPSADTEVYSAFTVGGTSRVSVVNSSNGK